MADLDTYVNAYLVNQVRKRTSYRTLETPLDGGGLGESRTKNQIAVFEWEITVGFTTEAAADAFFGYFSTQKGAAGRFTWTYPRDNHVYNCKFASDTLEEVWDGLDWWECTFTLRGVA